MLPARRITIHPTAVVETDAIGDGTVIGPNAYVGPTVMIGSDCVVGPGACLGQSGFGYAEQEDGTWERKPEDCGVTIGDRVEIGACVCIDRGSWRDTIIGDGVKIDNLVHVAHNVWVARNSLVIAHAMLAGSVTVEEGAWIGPGAQVRQRLRVGRRAFVAMGAVVVADVPDEWVVAGCPARPLRMRTGADK